MYLFFFFSTCGKCSSTYFESNAKAKEGGLFSDISDNDEPESFLSDNYVPSDKEESDFEDYLEDSTKDLFSDSEEKSIKNMFDSVDLPSDSDQETITATNSRKKRKTKRVDKTMKLPAIFSDNLASNNYDSTISLNDVFSDVEDGDALKEKKETKSKKKRRYSDYSDSSSSDSEPLRVFDPKRNKDVAKSSRSKKLITRAALKFNPYIVFNKLTRKKLSEENPYLTNIELSKLVSKAWRSMEETQKEKFIKEQKEKRDEMAEMKRKITKKRPAGNGYILYSAEELPKVKLEYPDIKAINDLSSIIGIRWKGLSKVSCVHTFFY